MKEKRDYGNLKFYVILTFGILPLRALIAFLSIVDCIFDVDGPFSIDYFDVGYLILCIAAFIGMVRFSRHGLKILGALLAYMLFNMLLNLVRSSDMLDIVTGIIAVLIYGALTVYCYLYFTKRKCLFEIKEKASPIANQETDSAQEGNYDVPSAKVFGVTVAQEENNEASPEEMSYITSEQKEKSDESGFKIILKSLLLAGSFIVVFSLLGVVMDNLLSCTYGILCFGKKTTLLQEKNFYTIAYSLTSFFELVLGFWLAYIFGKSEIVSYRLQGIVKEKKGFIHFAIGVLCGIIIDLAAGGLIVASGAKIVVNNITPQLLFTVFWGLPLYIGVGFGEEIMCRGILFGYCESKGRKIWGIILSTVFFVSLHFISGAYSTADAVVFLTFSGILMAVMKLYTNNIWLSVGYHFAYDWAVTYLLEIRSLQSNNSFLMFFGVVTKWKRSICVSIVAAIMTILFVILIKKKENAVAKML
ncbi:MAG: CPBP family intramembrane metalloprotease [Lachnospiraceae bacterium]|nr:CPBP family intramembrane metalloprotease [Lachnospiraceae bacterium]